MSGVMAKVSGGILLSTMTELRQNVEQVHQTSPQRLALAKAYLDSLSWGITGLEALGQKLGFVILSPPEPREFPKMLYRQNQYQIAENQTQEQSMLLEGFSPKVPAEPQAKLLEEALPVPPTFSINLPQGPAHGHDPDSEFTDC
jgi:hypothetical protein